MGVNLNKDAFELLCEIYVTEPLKNAVRDRRFRMTSHFCDRMKLRGMRLIDVSNAVSSGTVKSSEWDVKCKNWKCKVQGVDMNGNQVSIVAAISHKSGVAHLLTVF